MSAEPTAVYRFYNVSADLLYVGVSNDPEGRWKAHQWGPDRMPWISEVARRTVEWATSRELALDAEERAIKTERPRYNGKHNYDDAAFDPITWTPVNGRHKVPGVADQMRAEITTGRWKCGQRIPSLRVLANAAAVSLSIASKASMSLQGEGLLVFRSGHGLFVAASRSTYPKLPHDWPRVFAFPG